MLKRIVPVGVLAAALWIGMSATLARADDSVSNYQVSRTRELPSTPGDRLEPIATPVPGDDDMPNRTVRRPTPLPNASAVTPAGSSAARPTWYLALWQKVWMFGSKVVFFVKA